MLTVKGKTCFAELGHNFTLGNGEGEMSMKRWHLCIEISTEIRQDTVNTDQKVKWFLKCVKQTNFCEKHILGILFPSFHPHSHFTNLSMFIPPENESLAKKLLKITQFSITLRLFLQLCQVSFRSLSVIA